MTKQREKIYKKSTYKKEIEKIVMDIKSGNLDKYDIIPLHGYKKYYRIRVGKMRVVFKVEAGKNKIIAIDSRGDIYKHL